MLRAVSVVAGLSIAAAGLSVAPSSAEPAPSLEQVQARMDALSLKVAELNEDYGASRIELAQANRELGVVRAKVRTAQASVTGLRRDMSALAASAYRHGSTGQLVQLVSGSPQDFLDRASTLDRIAAGQSAQLAAAATARHRLDVAQALVAERQRAATAVVSRMQQQRSRIEAVLAEQSRLLGSLKAEQRRAYERARAQERAAALARASRQRSSVALYNGPASGRAAVAVKEAYAQLGKPYQWAAAGPDRFDCSGLTMWVWGKAGVSLPHQSRAQYAGGRKVAKSDLQPGDLTFYGSPIHHVGIYVGNGQMISAPQTGDVVKLQNALRSDYVGAVRP